MLGLRKTNVIVAALSAYTKYKEKVTPKPSSPLAKIIESVGVSPQVSGTLVALALSSVAAAVYALINKKQDDVDKLSDQIDSLSTPEVGSSPDKKSLPDEDTQESEPPSIPANISLPAKTVDAIKQPADNSLIDANSVTTIPQKSIPLSDGLSDITGALAIASEAYGNRKFVANDYAFKKKLDSASYGAFQLTGNTLKDYLKTSAYGKKFDKLTPGTPEFMAKWAEITDSSQGDAFVEDQKSYLIDKNLKPFVIAPLKRKGIDFQTLPLPTREFLFSAVINTPAKVRGAIEGLKKGATTRDIVIAVSRVRASTYANSKTELQSGLNKRIIEEASVTGVKVSLSELKEPLDSSQPIDVPPATPSKQVVLNNSPPLEFVVPPLPAQSVFKTKSGALAAS